MFAVSSRSAQSYLLLQGFVEPPEKLHRRRPVGDVLAHVTPLESAILPDDEGRRSGHTVSQQVVHAVPANHVSFRIGQDRELCSQQCSHVGGIPSLVDADSHNLHVEFPELCIGLLQLTELLTADVSEEAPIEDENDGLVVLE